MPEEDLALTAIRSALSDAGHNLAEIQVARRHRGAEEVLIEFNPLSSANWESGPEQHASYALTLSEHGWHPLDLRSLVLLPNVPFDARPGEYVATWAITSDEAQSPQGAAAEARERQIDPGITQSLWTVTDYAGRRTQVDVTDPDLS